MTEPDGHVMPCSRINEEGSGQKQQRTFVDASYSGHKKSAVFAQWRRQLLLQQYEAACHWTAEIDCSRWQAALWEKILVFASKQVHLHCPKIAMLVAKKYREFLHARCAPHHKCDNAALRRNLAQVIGVLCLSPKGPVYQLPKVDAHRIDITKLAKKIHPWLRAHHKSGDNRLALQFLSSILDNLDKRIVHKTLFWLSALLHLEKQLRKERKETITMATRRMEGVVLGNHAQDWVWLLWHALIGAPPCAQEPLLRRSLLDLAFLFARDYTGGKKTSRVHLLIHAMFLTSSHGTLNWQRNVYPSADAADLIHQACANIDVMYRDIRQAKIVQMAADETGAATTGHAKAADAATANPPDATSKTKGTAAGKKKGKASDLSVNSRDKLSIVDAIDKHMTLF